MRWWLYSLPPMPMSDHPADALLDLLADMLAERIAVHLAERLSMAPPPVAPESYTLDEAAQALAVSLAHVRRMVDAGAMRVVRVGRRITVPVSEVQRFAQQGAEWPQSGHMHPSPRPPE